jgi:hypothetical protein
VRTEYYRCNAAPVRRNDIELYLSCSLICILVFFTQCEIIGVFFLKANFCLVIFFVKFADAINP